MTKNLPIYKEERTIDRQNPIFEPFCYDFSTQVNDDQDTHTHTHVILPIFCSLYCYNDTLQHIIYPLFLFFTHLCIYLWLKISYYRNIASNKAICSFHRHKTNTLFYTEIQQVSKATNLSDWIG